MTGSKIDETCKVTKSTGILSWYYWKMLLILFDYRQMMITPPNTLIMKLFLFMILVPLFVSEFLDDKKNTPVPQDQHQTKGIATKAPNGDLTAISNQKKWQAGSMLLPSSASAIPGDNGPDYISFGFSKRALQPVGIIKIIEDTTRSR